MEVPGGGALIEEEVIDLVAPVRGFIDLTGDDEHDQRGSSEVVMVSSSSEEEGPAQTAIQRPSRVLSSPQQSQQGVANTTHNHGRQQPVPGVKEEPRSPTAASRQTPPHPGASSPPNSAGDAQALRAAGGSQEAGPLGSVLAAPRAACAAAAAGPAAAAAGLAGAADKAEGTEPSVSAPAPTDPSSPLHESVEPLGPSSADERPVAVQQQQEQEQDAGVVSPPASPSAASLSSPETSSSCQTGDGMQRAASPGGHSSPEASPHQGEPPSADQLPCVGVTVAEAGSLNPFEGSAPSPASKRQCLPPAAAIEYAEVHHAEPKALRQEQPGPPGPRPAPGALLAHAAAVLCRAAATAAASPQGGLAAAVGAAAAAAAAEGDPTVVLVLPQSSGPASAALAASLGGDAGAMRDAQQHARPDEAPTASTPHRPPVALLPLVKVEITGDSQAPAAKVTQPASSAPAEDGMARSGAAATEVDAQVGLAAAEMDAQQAPAAAVACPGHLLHPSSAPRRDVQAAASGAAPLPALAAVLAAEQPAAGSPPSPPGSQAGASGSARAGVHALVADLPAAVSAGAGPSPRRSGLASGIPAACQPPAQPTTLPKGSAAAEVGELAVPAPKPPAAAAAASDQAAAAAVAVAGPTAELAAPAPQPDQQAASGQGDYSNLRFLRSLIPAEVLQQYGPEQQVDPAAKSSVDEKVQAFHQEMKGLRDRQEAKNKADMRAVKNLRERNPDWLVWKPGVGHPPGVEVGHTFVGRCELAAAGVMANFMRGIDKRGDDPCHAVCVSGGYEDDLDHGDWLIYTGEGGRDAAGNQAADQEWTGGNKALRDAYRQALPVRVVRGSKENKLQYQYDGLYYIVRAEREANSNSVMVCKFWMVGIPGHYNPAARRVSFMALRGFKAMQLAGRADTPEWEPSTSAAAAAGGSSRKRAVGATTAAGKGKGVKRGADGNAKAKPKKVVPPPEQRPGFLLEDISNGLEAVKIPLFNEVDQDPAPTHFRYVRNSVTLSPAAQELERQAAALMPGDGRWCGLKQHRGKTFYLADGRMKETDTFGIWECCSGCSNPSCQRNRVVTEGVTLPLEVFKVPLKGWGARCSVDIPVGTVVVTYEGEVILNTDAEARGKRHSHADSYFFDLDHVLGMHADRTTKAKDRQRLPPLPPGLDPEEGEHLLVDALTIGNVARFINHSCDPNLVKQIVYTEGSSALKYKMVLVAARDIPAFEELVYDYCYKAGSVPEKEINCRCGARNCRKKLL